MDNKLEKLKNSISEICAKIADNEVSITDVEEMLYELTGEIDGIKESYEDKIYRIEKLLKS
jgi:peptidoglycan hydrolase CwlO-like protein